MQPQHCHTLAKRVCKITLTLIIKGIVRKVKVNKS